MFIIKKTLFIIILAIFALFCSSCSINNEITTNDKSKPDANSYTINNNNPRRDGKNLKSSINAVGNSEEGKNSNENIGESIKGSDEENKLVLYNFSLINGTGAKPMENIMIFIKKDRIEKIVKNEGTKIPRGYKKVDLKGYTVLPGFINSHVHCFFSEQDLQTWLKNGITTVRELATKNNTDVVSTKDEIYKMNKNPLNARIVIASPFITATGGYIPPFVDYVNTPKEASQTTKKYIKMGVDVIKISIEDYLQGNTWKLLSLEEIKSITKTAHKENIKVAVHLSHVRNLRLAIDGGVDELSHMVVEPLDEKLAKEIAEKGIYWVPTLELWQRVSKIHNLTWDKTATQNLSLFYKAGGKIALGTDFGGYSTSFDEGMPMTEISAMNAAGMTNMDIIVAATQNAAHVCGLEHLIGTVEEGKIADLIVVKDNPLVNIEALSKLFMVIHNGNIITTNE